MALSRVGEATAGYVRHVTHQAVIDLTPMVGYGALI
jgi:hypothetical protein